MSAEQAFMNGLEEEIEEMKKAKNANANKSADKLNSVEEELICAVCLEVYTEPTVIGSCLHTFCLNCIKSLG